MKEDKVVPFSKPVPAPETPEAHHHPPGTQPNLQEAASSFKLPQPLHLTVPIEDPADLQAGTSESIQEGSIQPT